MYAMKQLVFIPREYGNISFHLRKVLAAKHISRNELARAIGTRFEVIDKWCDGNVSRIDADVLARICYVLDCQVQDILTYEKS